MSALAAMFAPPRVRHTPTRVFVSGKEVRTKADIPPLPDAQDREKVVELIQKIHKRGRNIRYRERQKLKQESWTPEQKVAHQEKLKLKYMMRRLTPEAVERHRKNNRESRSRNLQREKARFAKWYQENKETVRQKQREYRERKRNEREQEKREHEQRAQAEAAQAIERGRKSSSAAHAKRVQTTANDARSISAASV